MKINELARKLGVSTRTIRFYEQNGLLPHVQREDNQYRVFAEEDIWRLQTIIALREAGMAIKDIQEVLEPQGLPDHERLRYYLELQYSMLTGQWLEMRRMADTTEQMLELLRQNQELQLDEFYGLAQQAKQLRELRQNWRDHWGFDQRADQHDDYVHTSSKEYPGYELALDHTAAVVRAGGYEKGLDLGTGTGNLAGRLIKQGIPMSGIDQSREMIKQCRIKFPNMDVRIGNLLSIPYPDHYFDFVVSSFAFRHLDRHQLILALSEIRRVLKPYGRMCITERYSDQEQTLPGQESLPLVMQHWLEEHYYMINQTSPHPSVFTILAVPMRAD